MLHGNFIIIYFIITNGVLLLLIKIVTEALTNKLRWNHKAQSSSVGLRFIRAATFTLSVA